MALAEWWWWWWWWDEKDGMWSGTSSHVLVDSCRWLVVEWDDSRQTGMRQGSRVTVSQPQQPVTGHGHRSCTRLAGHHTQTGHGGISLSTSGWPPRWPRCQVISRNRRNLVLWLGKSSPWRLDCTTWWYSGSILEWYFSVLCPPFSSHRTNRWFARFLLLSSLKS